MTYKEILNKIQICKSPFGKLRFIIVKRQEGNIAEASERRDLTEQEVFVYTTEFIDYLLSKGITDISDHDTGAVWKFSKEQKSE